MLACAASNQRPVDDLILAHDDKQLLVTTPCRGHHREVAGIDIGACDQPAGLLDAGAAQGILGDAVAKDAVIAALRGLDTDRLPGQPGFGKSFGDRVAEAAISGDHPIAARQHEARRRISTRNAGDPIFKPQGVRLGQCHAEVHSKGAEGVDDDHVTVLAQHFLCRTGLHPRQQPAVLGQGPGPDDDGLVELVITGERDQPHAAVHVDARRQQHVGCAGICDQQDGGLLHVAHEVRLRALFVVLDHETVPEPMRSSAATSLRPLWP